MCDSSPGLVRRDKDEEERGLSEMVSGSEVDEIDMGMSCGAVRRCCAKSRVVAGCVMLIADGFRPSSTLGGGPKDMTSLSLLRFRSSF